MSGDHFTRLDNCGDRPTENCTVESKDSDKKSKKRKRNLNTMSEADCHITTLERFYKRVVLCLSRPSFLLGLGSINVRPENRSRLCELLRKLMRRHNWIEASGVLSVLLKGTCKDNCLTTNRFKYLASMELLKLEDSDPVNTIAINGLYDTWMSRIGINLAYKRRRVECTKEDSFIVRLESILFNLMRGNVEGERYNARSLTQEHEFESHPVFNVIIGLIFCQLWYSSIPQDWRWRDTYQIQSPAHSETSDIHPQSHMSRFSYEVGHSKKHNALLSDESYTSFQYNSETSVMNGKKVSVEADYDLHREGVPVKVGIEEEDLQHDFHAQGFYANSAENEPFVDNNAGYVVPSVVNLSAFKKLDSWMLPIRIGSWELDRAIQADEYQNAVKYLRSAVHSNPPRLDALLPLTQLLLIGCRDKEALNELEEFSANSGAVLPRRLRANILERFDHNNSHVLSTCFEDILKIDPTCRESLAKLISLHQDGNYRPESLLEVAALHLDAVFAECNVWREFAICFLEVHKYEEDQLSVCPNANERGQVRGYSVRYNSIPKSFTHGKLRKAWAFRCKWWLKRHFSRSILASEIAAGDLELLSYKAACASHMYGLESEYVVEVYHCLGKENNVDLITFLEQHRQNSIGLYPYFQQKN